MAKKALLMILDGWGLGKHGKGDVIFNKENNGINLVILSLIRNFEALPRTFAQKSSKYFGFLFAYSYLCSSKET